VGRKFSHCYTCAGLMFIEGMSGLLQMVMQTVPSSF